MDRLELRRVAVYPSVETNEIVILIGNFSIPSGLRVAEAALSNQQVCLNLIRVIIEIWEFDLR